MCLTSLRTSTKVPESFGTFSTKRQPTAGAVTEHVVESLIDEAMVTISVCRNSANSMHRKSVMRPFGLMHLLELNICQWGARTQDLLTG